MKRFRYKYFSKEDELSEERVEKRKDNEKKKLAEIVAGSGLLYGGYKIAKKNKSKITGLENFYHSADQGVVDSIKKEGLKAKFAEDPGNLTNAVLGKTVDKSKLKGKVYLGRRKSVADSVGYTRDMNYTIGRVKNENYTGKSKTLKINIPFEELKKLNEVDNPELGGAKNAKEYARRIWKNAYKNAPEEANQIKEMFGKKGRNAFARILAESGYKDLSRDGTAVFENDIDSKFIKGSKNYEKYGLSKFKEYVKNNPKRFAKGLGMGILGTGIGVTGAVLLGKALKENKKKDPKRKNEEKDDD
jgi:hypothetical protein